MARGLAEGRATPRSRQAAARAFCAAATATYWSALNERYGAALKLRECRVPVTSISVDAMHLARETGRLVADFPAEDAGYLLGSIYTVMLPTSMRSKLGAYYTPPPLAERLIDLAISAGFDLRHGTAIDPACGGGAFLAPLALRMVQASPEASPEWTLRHVASRLRGYEIDPFAAWLTTVLVEAAVLPLCIAAGRRMRDVVCVDDALRPRRHPQFDLVIGNPPYGRVTLDEGARAHYERSLYGHANLYGLFCDLALRLRKKSGVIAYLTPTSFLGGQYFKALRKLLVEQTTPCAFEFVADRDGVFDDVLQETLLTVFRQKVAGAVAQVTTIVPSGLNAARLEPIGSSEAASDGSPWLLPRRLDDAKFLVTLKGMSTRLSDMGYAVSTGQLVWNRHKDQLRVAADDSTLPLIWAEAITPSGFVFSADRRNHVPYIEVLPSQPHLITRESCVLVQRTTSKEQNRRLLAAVLPQPFLDAHGGAVVENHVNLLYAARGASAVEPATLAALFNTATVDRAFRCISGSVAVSAYELQALPLPTPTQLRQLERMVVRGGTERMIERLVQRFYGLGEP
jgi:predicted RNA methylase